MTKIGSGQVGEVDGNDGCASSLLSSSIVDSDDRQNTKQHIVLKQESQCPLWWVYDALFKISKPALHWKGV